MAHHRASPVFSPYRCCASFASIITLVVAQFVSVAAWACRENAMIVFDASGSMALVRDGQSKMVSARRAAREVLPNLTRNRPTGPVTYSGGKGRACEDVSLRLRPSSNSGVAIASHLDRIEPDGATPLSPAVKLAANTLKELGPPGVVVLITDGLENCGNDACALGEELRRDSYDVKIHVISFYLHARATDRIECLAKLTGGTYTTTASLDGLKEALRKTLGCPRVSKASLTHPIR